MWNSHNDRKRLVREVWNRPAFGCPMSSLSQKLKLLKSELKNWNKTVFGDVNLKVKKAWDEVDLIQAKLSSS